MKFNYHIISVLALAILSVQGLSAQTFPDRKDVRKGNRDFKKENYKEAEIDYRKALVKDSTSFAANYNLGNALYKMNDYQQAGNSYKALEPYVAGRPEASDLFYNTGNVSVQAKDWQAAVEAYKKSLLLNPGDLDAKENYIYAKKMLENQQSQQNQQNQQDNQDNNSQPQNKDQEQNQPQNQEQDKEDKKDNKDNGENEKNNPQQGQSDSKITPQAAQQMLQAIQAKEKETQEKVNKEKVQALKSRQKEKNW